MPVILFEDTLFFIYSKLGPFSPSDRANSIVRKLDLLIDENQYDPALLKVVEGNESQDIVHGDVIILSITDRDAFWVGIPVGQLASQYLTTISDSIKKYQDDTGLWKTLLRVALIILVVGLFFFGIRYLNKVLTLLSSKILGKGKRYLKGVKLKNYEFLSAEREEQVLGFVLIGLKWLVILIIFYISLPILFSIFPATKGIAATLIGYVVDPLKKMAWALLGFLPELITIIVIVVVTNYFVKFLRFLAMEVQYGKLKNHRLFILIGPDPTFNILKILVYAFSFVMIFPYLPGSDSSVFRGVSVFLGVLFFTWVIFCDKQYYCWIGDNLYEGI